MVDQRSWVHVLSVISRGCDSEINVWVLSALLQRLNGSACQYSDHTPHTTSNWSAWLSSQKAASYKDVAQESPGNSLGRRAVFQHDNYPKHTSKSTTALLKNLRVKVICGASSNRRWRSTRSLTSTSSVMSSWRSGRGLQWQREALVNSMPKRVKAVLENNGGHTKYWHFGPNLDIFT